MAEKLDPMILQALAALDTCSVSNAIETFGLRLRNEGYADHTVFCCMPELPSMVGYAETIKVRASAPPPDRKAYLDRTDWWTELKSVDSPRVLVIEDVDRATGAGAFIGGVHAHIFKALGCVGAITNGAVRDLPEVAGIEFQLFAGSVSPSHAYMHVVEYGCPVTIGGLKILPGDLVHADRHGIVTIPKEIAGEIAAVVEELHEREQKIINLCLSGKFSMEALCGLLARNSNLNANAGI